MTEEQQDGRKLSDEELVLIRTLALRGIELGYTQTELAVLLGVRQETISRWWAAYRAEGAESLPGPRTGRPQGSGRALSDEQAEHIKSLILDKSPNDLGLPHALWTRRAVGDLIRKEFGVSLSDRCVGEYLSRWGYTPKKPSRRSRRQDPEEVEIWLNDTYPLIEEQAQQEDAVILWADEVGVQADHCPGTSYAPRGERAEVDVPRPHIRTNQITAISNEGELHFMNYDGAMTAAVFLIFLKALVVQAPKKILLIVDQLQAHKTPEVDQWVWDNEDRIELFLLPTYSPDLNPVEYLNNDLKGRINKAGMPDNLAGLRRHLLAAMDYIAQIPSRVMNFFLHPDVQYAAHADLLID